MNYQEAGVDIIKGDQFIDRIKPFIRQTYNKHVVSGVGGFAALYDQGDHYLATGTDGVGTKIKLAIELGVFDTIGIDLVAMCVNDILCTGASPMFFLDYLASSSLNLDTHEKVVQGIVKGCQQSSCALIGGETAEMPGMYHNDDFDMAGFVVGRVDKTKYIDGKKIKAGMSILALSSSGFHSNGFSLIRNLIKNENKELKELCLTPTRIYSKEAQTLLSTNSVYGMAHITGGGLNNIERMNKDFGYEIQTLPSLPNYYEHVLNSARLTQKEYYTTFNMGIGFVFVTDKKEELTNAMPELFEIGVVTDQFSGVKVKGHQCVAPQK